MNNATIQYLNDLDRRFYETVAIEFDTSRQQAWPGWEPLVPYLNPPLSVLDVGCGNGRFGVFLADRLGKDRLRYVGIDSSAALLDRARIALVEVNAHLEQRDLVDQPLDAALGQFDLVVLFGVLHHIPGTERRLGLLRSLAEWVAPGGLLVFTEWRFLEDARLSKRIVPWDDTMQAQVEAGDYLLDWRRGERALRYCHFVDADEHTRLVRATCLKMVIEYQGDVTNHYTVLSKNSS